MAWLARCSHNPRDEAIAHLTHVNCIRRIVTKEPLLDDTLDDIHGTNRNEQAEIHGRIQTEPEGNPGEKSSAGFRIADCLILLQEHGFNAG